MKLLLNSNLVNSINKKALAALIIFAVVILGVFVYGDFMGTSQPYQNSSPLLNPTHAPT
jgi:hypothetical protein